MTGMILLLISVALVNNVVLSQFLSFFRSIKKN